MNDLGVPIEEAVKIAEPIVEAGGTVTFKFTCEACGARCFFEEPNTWFDDGECFDCGHITHGIELYGLMVAFTIGKKDDAAQGS